VSTQGTGESMQQWHTFSSHFFKMAQKLAIFRFHSNFTWVCRFFMIKTLHGGAEWIETIHLCLNTDLPNYVKARHWMVAYSDCLVVADPWRLTANLAWTPLKIWLNIVGPDSVACKVIHMILKYSTSESTNTYMSFWDNFFKYLDRAQRLVFEKGVYIILYRWMLKAYWIVINIRRYPLLTPSNAVVWKFTFSSRPLTPTNSAHLVTASTSDSVSLLNLHTL